MTATFSLAEQASAVQAVVSASGGNLRPPPEILAVSLAQFFDYNVTKGGFAQLIYNLQGEYLQEVEQMLILAEAAVAGEYYERAIRLCAASPVEYQNFVGNHFMDTNSLKDALHALSIEYFRRQRSFDAEIDSFVKVSSERVSTWLQAQAQNAG